MTKLNLLKTFISLMALSVLSINCSSNDNTTNDSSSEISLTTTSVTSITSNTAVSGGNIITNKNANITAKGICWSITPNPTINLTSKTTESLNFQSFTSNLLDLNPGTTYYIRAYVTNNSTTIYGNEISFTTEAIVPILTTSITEKITPYTVSSGGNITSDGGNSITQRGVCWDTNPNPTIILSTKTNNGSGTGNFSSNITDLLDNTKYYVRSYATNSKGTGYGNEIVFTTAIDPFSIGTNYQGGKIFYIFKPGDIGYKSGETHGLIVSPNDLNPSPLMSVSEPMLTSNEIGTGNANTVKIVGNAKEANGQGAGLCMYLILNGYDDWYLPSYLEFCMLVQNRKKVGFESKELYWTSSTDGYYPGTATAVSGESTNGYFKLRSEKLNVRAIRSF